MIINIDTIQKKCTITLNREDRDHVKNLLLLKQASEMAIPDSNFQITIDEGWDIDELGQIESFAKEISFGINMRHGDINFSGQSEIVEKLNKLNFDAIDETSL